MEVFEAASGAWHNYYKNFTWQPLETACVFFPITHKLAPTAAGDACVTAQIMHAMAQMAEEELPAGYHLPRDMACAGGCGNTETSRYGEAGDGEDWYVAHAACVPVSINCVQVLYKAVDKHIAAARLAQQQALGSLI